MTNLELKWTISKAKDTYGYNVVTLWDRGKRYKASGGGYDMTGTVFANWLWENYSHKIISTIKDNEKDYYGFKKYVREDKESYYIDGACGLDCMLRIAKAIGLEVQSIYGRRELTNFLVQ